MTLSENQSCLFPLFPLHSSAHHVHFYSVFKKCFIVFLHRLCMILFTNILCVSFGQCCQVRVVFHVRGLKRPPITGYLSLPKNVYFTPRNAIFMRNPPRNAIGLVLSSNWVGFVVKTWQSCIRAQN